MRIKDVFGYIKFGLSESRRYTICYFIVAVLYLSIGFAMPYISGIYVDRLVTDADMDIIWMFVLAFAVVYIVQSVIYLGWNLISSLFSNTFFYHMVINPVRHIMKSRFSKYHNMESAKLVNQLRDDGVTFLTFVQATLSAATGLVTILLGIGFLFFIDVFVGVLIFATLPLYLLLYLGFRKKLYEKDKVFREKSDIYFSKRNEQLNRMAFVKRNELSEELGQRVDVAFNDFISKNLSLNFVEFFFTHSGRLTSAAFHVIIIGVGGYRVIHGDLSIGYFTMITLYFNMVIQQVGSLFGFASGYQSVRVATGRTEEIYENPIDPNGETKIEHIQQLEVRDLSLCYGDNKVFSGINKTFEVGKMYAICGENGSGKSSFLNCIVGLYGDISTGDILFDGVSMNDIDMAYMRRNRMSFVEQSPEFLSMSIGDYLNFGIEQSETTNRNKHELISALGISKFDFEDTITESGSNYSGGEKQKLTIVRALSKDCAIAILDEPTSALDTDSVDALADMLTKQKVNRITLIISHDARILSRCDEEWRIDS
ncbi:MAG: ABC transporter ATP-binding protein/permease [Defluviitaleaceae bacterium]|nr:ABC transporter ATP-binding protein/permease [Defluviitaleaceae bacterium]